MGHDLAELGITCTHAPVLDVRQQGAHDVIGDRAYGSEPLRVAALGRAVLDGLARAGIAGTIKHMPGHGRTTDRQPPCHANRHRERRRAGNRPRPLPRAQFRADRHDRALVFTAWDAGNPATLSPYVIGEVIRRQIGFGGLLLTDDLDMEALTGTVPQRAERAIAAGCDIALNCWAKMDDMVGIASALPAMGAETSARLGRALEDTRVDGAAGSQPELLAKRDALLGLAAA